MNRFANLCDNAHWQSPATCFPGPSATTGCGCGTQATNGCADQTCWQLEDNAKGFWTYDSAPSFGSFFRVAHCFEGSPPGNRYAASACPTNEVAPQVGYIAASPISIWQTAVWRCQLTTNAGAIEHMFVTKKSECTNANGTILDSAQFGYVVP